MFYRDAKGAWQPINTAVAADPTTPGGLVSKANTWTAHFAPLPTGVRIDSPEGPISFSPVGAARVAPTLTAVDTVTYLNAWPGVDLRYQVLGDEVKETIVLNRRPTSATFSFLTAGLGFSAASDGALTPKRANSSWTLAAPVIEDKQGTPLPGAQVALNAVGAASTAGVAVALSPPWLAAQPDSAFPILIDPTAVYGSGNMTAYKSDGTTCSACGLQVGNPAQSNGTFYWRSVGYFDYSALFGQHIANATVTVSSLAGGTANGEPFSVWLPTAYSYTGAVGGGLEASGTVDTQGSISSTALSTLLDYWVHNRIGGGSLGFSGFETVGQYTYKQLDNFTLSLTSYTAAPTAPQNPTASATPDGVLHASWSPPVDDGGAPVSYQINLYHQGGGAAVNGLTCSGLGVSWTGLADKTSWYFGITAINSAGASAEVFTNIVTVTHPPGTPTALLSYPGNGAAYVTWSPPADPGGTPIDRYLLAAVDETDPNHPQTTAATTCCSGFPIIGMTNGHAYAVVVYAHDDDGYSPTPAVSTPTTYVTPSSSPPPYPVQQVYYTTAGNGEAFITWRPPLTSNGGAQFTKYAITAYDSVTGYLPPQQLNIGAGATSFTYTGLANGHTYQFAISAGNSAGYATVFTNTVTPTTTPPPNPVTNATAKAGDTYAVLQWLQPNNSGVTAATNYLVYRFDYTNPVTPVYLDYQVTNSALTSYTWGGLADGTPYLFYVVALNNNGFASFVATNTVTPLSGLGDLLNPYKVVAIAADRTAVVSWNAPTIGLLSTYTVTAINAQTGAAAVTGSPTGGGGPCATGSASDPPVVASPPSPCQVVTGLSNGTSYYFVVTDSLLNVLQVGKSSPSAPITPAGLPFTPIGPSASAGNQSATVSWQTPANNGSTITGYLITTYLASDNAVVNSPLPAPASPAVVNGLTNNTAYYFGVQAVNGVGAGPASLTNTITPISPPAAPTDVIAAAGDAVANVGWVPSDPSVAPTDGYTVTACPGQAAPGCPGGTSTYVGGGGSSNASFTALVDGTIYTFAVVAQNSQGNSAAALSNSVLPTAPVTAPAQNPAMAQGGSHSLAVNTDGTVEAWGLNTSGQLGDGSTTASVNGVQAANLSNVIAVAAGGAFSLALRGDGTVWAWGDNSHNQLGYVGSGSATPVQVAGLTGISAIAAGTNHALALTSGGVVWAWGSDASGQLGQAIDADSPDSVPIIEVTNAVNIAAAGDFSLALTGDGTVWAWGDNSSGQLGTSAGGSSAVANPVSGLPPIHQVVAGQSHALALDNSGNVWAWGDNSMGQLGDNSTVSSSTPVKVVGLVGVTEIAAGSRHSVALESDGTAWSWGANEYGEIGNGTPNTNPNPLPSKVIQTNTTAFSGGVAVAAGSTHTLLVDSAGVVWELGQHYTGGDCALAMARTQDPKPTNQKVGTVEPIPVPPLTGTSGPGSYAMRAQLQYGIQSTYGQAIRQPTPITKRQLRDTMKKLYDVGRNDPNANFYPFSKGGDALIGAIARLSVSLKTQPPICVPKQNFLQATWNLPGYAMGFRVDLDNLNSSGCNLVS